MELSLRGFEKHKVAKGAKEPRITVSKNGLIHFNNFLAKGVMKDFISASIYFNKGTQTVAVEMFEGEEGEYRLGRHRGGVTISSTTFVKAQGFFESDSTIRKTEWLGTSDGDSVIYFKIL